MKQKTKKIWCENKKDLATKEMFNTFWFGLWMFSLIIGVRHIEIVGDWKGYLIAFFSVGMLMIQQIWQWQMINYLRGKKK